MGQYKIRCTNPDCQRSLRVGDESLGRRVRCPACKQENAVPGSIAELAKLGPKYCRVYIVKGPAFAGTEHPLDPSRAYTFGRSDECNVQLPGATVSRRHFSLHWVNEQWVLEDLNTTTGTQIDGLGVTKFALRGGETIEVGAYTLRFLLPEEHLRPSAELPPVVVAPRGAEPLRVKSADDVDHSAAEEERRLREAQGFSNFTPEHLSEVGQESARGYSLSLAGRLVIAAGLLAGVTVLSLVGKAWLSGYWSGKSDVAAQAGPALEPLPAVFEEAIGSGDFAAAARFVREVRGAGTYGDLLCNRMEEELQRALRSEWDGLWQRAQLAVQEERWSQVGALIKSAEALPLEPPPNELVGLRAALRQHEQLVEADTLRGQRRWGEALAKVEAAERAAGANPRTAGLRTAIENEMGAGLFVKVAPAAEGVRVTVNNKEVAAAQRECWQLPVGSAVLRVAAAGHFDYEQSVELKLGQLTAVDVRLTAKAPPEMWTLLALEQAGATGPLWLAAKHYGRKEVLPATVISPTIKLAEGPASRKLGRTELRVARITLKGGEQLTARVLSDTDTGLTVQTFPKGETRLLQQVDVGAKQDLESERAAEVILEWIKSRRDAGTPLLETLEQLAKLSLDLGGQEELAARVCGPFVETCLHEAADVCAFCAGACTADCPACAGKGLQVQRGKCDRCNGTKSVACQTCKGSGKIKCEKCGGDGHISKVIREGRTTRTVEEPCPKCTAKGVVPCAKCHGGALVCPKCKGAGEVDEKVDCPQCKKGLIPCPACRGLGTRAAMIPEKLREAEIEAAKRCRPVP